MEKSEEFIQHHGVKGMKWGVRKAVEKSSAFVARKAAKKRAASSEDARNAQDAHVKSKKNGLHSLSNKELQDLVTRMNLEQQFNRLKPPSTSEKAAKFIGKTLGDIGKQQVNKLANDVVSKEIAKLFAGIKV